MEEDSMQLFDTKQFAANRAKELIHAGTVQNTFKDILEWIKECTLEKTNKVVDSAKVVMEYAKLCACERIKNGSIDRIRSEINTLVEKHSRENNADHTHDEDKGVEI